MKFVFYNDYVSGGYKSNVFRLDAISNFDICDIINTFYPSVAKYFKGVYLWDQDLYISKYKKCNKWCIILCTNKTTDKRSKIGHWVSLIIDNDKREFLYYDSFGEEPKEIKKFYKHLQKFKKYPHELYQLKINKVKHQRVDSARCGYFAILFLVAILEENKTFKEATNFNTLVGEHKAKLLQNQFLMI